MTKILIVEDEPAIAAMIREILKLSDYSSDICNNEPDALQAVCTTDYDLILLDVMLPGMDGFEIMDAIRDFGFPVIFLTAKQGLEDKVRGLRAGADDYIVKPFEAMELTARIEAVLRRKNQIDASYHYRNIEYQEDSHRVLLDGKAVHMTPKEFELFGFFLKNQGLVISREKLFEAIWGYRSEGESRTVDAHINQLRKKLGLQNELLTVPRLGYRLIRIKS